MELKNTKNVVGAVLAALGIGIGIGMIYEFGRSSGRVEVENALLNMLENDNVTISEDTDQDSD